jgi:hypothetical protein
MTYQKNSWLSAKQAPLKPKPVVPKAKRVHVKGEPARVNGKPAQLKPAPVVLEAELVHVKGERVVLRGKPVQLRGEAGYPDRRGGGTPRGGVPHPYR